MVDASLQLQSSPDLEERVRTSLLSRGLSQAKSRARALSSLASDPYSASQFLANGVERVMRFYVVHNFVTGDDNTFLVNVGEMALLTAISACFHETFTTPMHRWLFHRRRGSTEGFITSRVEVEAQHYKARGIITPLSWTATAAAESFLGIPREITTQVAGIPFGLAQGGYSTDVRRRVDAGLPLDRPIDMAVRASYVPFEAAWKLLRGPELFSAAATAGRNVRRLGTAALTYTAHMR